MKLYIYWICLNKRTERYSSQCTPKTSLPKTKCLSHSLLYRTCLHWFRYYGDPAQFPVTFESSVDPFEFSSGCNRRLPRPGNRLKPVHKNPIFESLCFFRSTSGNWKCDSRETGCRKMGSCLSVEGEQQRQKENGSSCGNPGVYVDSQSPEKSGSVNSNTFVIIPRNIKDLRQSPGNGDLDIFTYEEMKLATKDFRPDQVLGEGGFGIVYRGVIDESVRPGCKKTQIAVKVLDPESGQGDREWLAEVNYLGQLRHPNLVKLIGYSCEDDHRLLVYEYMASGSLEKHLFLRVRTTLTWHKRLKIALDTAKGLAFLHGVEKPIIYRDFKTSNILLDKDFNAKLSDFGLARIGPTGDQTHVSTRVMGTYGYAAPEYVMTGHLTARSDVYGFGVVLLEMLIGRRAMDKSRPSREHNLVEWARPLLNHGKKLLRILDPRIEGQYSTKILMKVANLAYQCLSQNPKGRPIMTQVIEILEPLVAQEMSLDETIQRRGGGSITLYEAPKDKQEDSNRGSRNKLKNESTGEDEPCQERTC